VGRDATCPGDEGQERIRIDGAVPLPVAGRDHDVISQLENGRVVTTRSYEWPRCYPEDETFELTGFAQALTYVRLFVSNAGPLFGPADFR
jgi:hypothetical protein